MYFCGINKIRSLGPKRLVDFHISRSN
uniref:Uncharacterized protein n=1 Tax=Anguilla anguilla TaxID=7936 RepID=A0A0E9V7S9_ANGAN